MSNDPSKNSTRLNNIKKRARFLKSEHQIKHTEALEMAAKDAGFPSYLKAKHRTTSAQTSSNLPEYIERVIFWSAQTKENHNSRYHMYFDQDYPPVIPSSISSLDYPQEILKKIALQGTESDHEYWRIVAYALDKERMKESGRRQIAEGKPESGYIDMALAYFFRSVATALEGGRNHHPSFSGFLFLMAKSGELLSGGRHVFEKYGNSVDAFGRLRGSYWHAT